MADFLKNLDKHIKDWHILTLLGLLVLGYVIYQYSGRQNRLLSNYQGVTSAQSNNVTTASAVNTAGSNQNQVGALVQSSVSPLDPISDTPGSLTAPSSITQVSGSTIAPVPTTPGTVSVQSIDPADLLPSGGAGQSLSGNFLNARELNIGMQSSVLRNANQTIRKDPPIPTQVGPPCQFQSNITAEMGGGGLNVDC